MKQMLKIWYQTRDKRYTTRDKIKNFFWVIRHPLLTVRLAHYAMKVLASSGVGIEDITRRDRR